MCFESYETLAVFLYKNTTIPKECKSLIEINKLKQFKALGLTISNFGNESSDKVWIQYFIKDILSNRAIWEGPGGWRIEGIIEDKKQDWFLPYPEYPKEYLRVGETTYDYAKPNQWFLNYKKLETVPLFNKTE